MFNLMLALLYCLINTSNTETILFQAHENNGNLPGVRCIIRDYKEIILSRNDTCSNIFSNILKSHDFITFFANLLSHRVNFLSLLTECVIYNKGECGFDQPIIGLDKLKEQLEMEYKAARRAYNDLENFLMISFDEQTPEMLNELVALYERQRTDIIEENAKLRSYSFDAFDEIAHFSVVFYTTFADSKSIYGIYDKNIEQQLLTTESRIRFFVMLITKHLNWQEKTRKRHRQARESWLQITNE